MIMDGKYRKRLSYSIFTAYIKFENCFTSINVVSRMLHAMDTRRVSMSTGENILGLGSMNLNILYYATDINLRVHQLD